MTINKTTRQILNLTAETLINELNIHQSNLELEKIKRYFKNEYSVGDEFMGVKMGQVFKTAKAFIDLPINEIEKLLESPIHEVRTAGVSIMDFQARNKKTTGDRKKALFELYINRHDRINNWDLVDRSAPYVVGGYLFNKPRDVLYELAISEHMWERRTSIVSTYFFIRQNQLDDTFKIAEILVNDTEDLIHKATGGWLREAGKKDRAKLISFLEKHASTMPRTMLRNAIEHFDKGEKEYYLGLKATFH
ncbi:DNA alkylation repair protein [Pedobacter paludis]|uniref:DNA alkylation repair protein n=1 Tax=Pedobacter paludis TaxID=2203212 RepID=UPI00197E9740|nr:DNA alkylation repair protein [Pedobacter paludis]